jgi:Mn-dependent DtxR family transcriptional regulator
MNGHSDMPIKVLKLLEKQQVITTSEVASSLKVSWNTAEKALLELTIDGKIQRVKKAGVNLWLKIK